MILKDAVAAGVLATALAVAGCQHRPPNFGGAYHETNPETCRQIAAGLSLHEQLKRMRKDGTCDIWQTRN